MQSTQINNGGGMAMNSTRRTFQFLLVTVALTLLLGEAMGNAGHAAAAESAGWQFAFDSCIRLGGSPIVYVGDDFVSVTCVFPNGQSTCYFPFTSPSICNPNNSSVNPGSGIE